MLLWQIVTSLLIYSATCHRVKLSCSQKRMFVDGHNWKRLQVAQGQLLTQPAAANMKYMIWDDELAEKAARWAENGKLMHNPDKTIWSKRWNNFVGENIHINITCPAVDTYVIPGIDEALQDWFDEHKQYFFQLFFIENGIPTGHYTQMIWADSNRVGCGISQKKENRCTTTLFVCNYGPAGNYKGKLPYWINVFKGGLQCANNGECSRPYGEYC